MESSDWAEPPVLVSLTCSPETGPRASERSATGPSQRAWGETVGWPWRHGKASCQGCNRLILNALLIQQPHLALATQRATSAAGCLA